MLAGEMENASEQFCYAMHVCDCRSPAEGAYSEGFVTAKFTQVRGVNMHDTCMWDASWTPGFAVLICFRFRFSTALCACCLSGQHFS